MSDGDTGHADKKRNEYAPGHVIVDKYRVVCKKGRGVYGTVYSVQDVNDESKTYAIKVIHRDAFLQQRAKQEVEIHKFVQGTGVEGIVRFIDDFTDEHGVYHVLLESLDVDLLHATQVCMRKRINREIINDHLMGVSLNVTRQIAKQLLTTMDHFATHGIVHGDLKPENIMLVNRKKTDIKVIDLGLSFCDTKSSHSFRTTNADLLYTQSRFYRAPEVLLELHPYTTQIDMWSIACILVEIHTGSPLFVGESEFYQFQQIIQLCGMPPTNMLENSSKKLKFFNKSKDAYVSKQPNTDIVECKTVEQVQNALMRVVFSSNSREHTQFSNLLAHLLRYDPRERWTAKQALEHVFLVDGC